MGKEWVNIKCYEHIYKVSNTGDVMNHKTGLVLKNFIGSHGYYTVNLSNNGKQKCTCVHKLVAEHFLQPTNTYECVNHIDGNKLNNNIANLELVTYSENNKHAYSIGLKTPVKHIKHSRDVVVNICLLLETNAPSDVAKITGINRNTIQGIYNGNTHLEISSEFKFIVLDNSGCNNYNAKFNKEQISNIIEAYSKGAASSRHLAKKYGCSKTTILNIVNKKSYK